MMLLFSLFFFFGFVFMLVFKFDEILQDNDILAIIMAFILFTISSYMYLWHLVLIRLRRLWCDTKGIHIRYFNLFSFKFKHIFFTYGKVGIKWHYGAYEVNPAVSFCLIFYPIDKTPPKYNLSFIKLYFIKNNEISFNFLFPDKLMTHDFISHDFKKKFENIIKEQTQKALEKENKSYDLDEKIKICPTNLG